MKHVWSCAMALRVAALLCSCLVAWRRRNWRWMLLALLVGASLAVSLLAWTWDGTWMGVAISELVTSALAAGVAAAGWDGLLPDGLARERAEELRLRSERRLRAIIDNTPNVAVEVYDAEGVVLFWNGAAERLFGWTAAEAVGKTLDELILSGDEAKQFVEVLGDIAKTGRPHGPMEWRVRTKSGEERWAYSTIFAVPSAEGGQQFICMDVDTTDRRRAEDAARQAQQELVEHHQREAELVAEELARARDELVRQTRLATLGRVSGQIAHEVRNPLGSIRNSCFYLRRKLSGDLPNVHEHLANIEREVAACDRIVESLLDVTRVRSPRREAVDLVSLAEEAVERLCRPEGVRVRVDARTKPISVEADRVQMRQVLDNLLENARDAVGERGEIAVELGCVNGAALVRVRDNGCGIAAEHREAVFDLLFTTKPHGTGLGLCVCRQIVEAHGGTLGLRESEEAGAVFEVRLPEG